MSLKKGWRGVSALQRQRFDLSFGVSCMFLVGALLQIAAAGTIRPLEAKLDSVEDLVRIFTETQGTAGLIVFGLGLWGVAFSGLIGATAGYALIVRDICRSYVPSLKGAGDHQEAKRDPIYRWAVVFF